MAETTKRCVSREFTEIHFLQQLNLTNLQPLTTLVSTKGGRHSLNFG